MQKRIKEIKNRFAYVQRDATRSRKRA